MIDRISATHSHNPALIQHTQAKVSFFSLMDQFTSITTDSEEHVPPDSMCGTNKGIRNKHSLGVRHRLAKGLFPAYIDTRNCNRADTRIVEFLQRLLGNTARRE